MYYHDNPSLTTKWGQAKLSKRDIQITSELSGFWLISARKCRRTTCHLFVKAVMFIMVYTASATGIAVHGLSVFGLLHEAHESGRKGTNIPCGKFLQLRIPS